MGFGAEIDRDRRTELRMCGAEVGGVDLSQIAIQTDANQMVVSASGPVNFNINTAGFVIVGWSDPS